MIHSLLVVVLVSICSGILILSIPGCNRLKQSAVEALSRVSGQYLNYGVFLFYVLVGLLFLGTYFLSKTQRDQKRTTIRNNCMFQRFSLPSTPTLFLKVSLHHRAMGSMSVDIGNVLSPVIYH